MMVLHENSLNAVVVIPYRKFKEKIRIVKEEIEKGRKVEVDEKFIYSFAKENVKVSGGRWGGI